MGESRYLSCAETAKLVRAALAKNFPGIKFSVTSKTYSGGASIDIHWTLGPTSKEVDHIAGQYESASFDGMIDMEVHYSHWLLPDGSTRIESTPGSEGSLGYIPAIKPTARPDGAELVSFGAHYIHGARKYTEDYKQEELFFERIAKDMCALQKVAYTGLNTMHLFGPNDDHKDVKDYVYQLLSHTSFKPGEEYDGLRYATEEERNSSGWDPWTVFVAMKKGGIAVPDEGGILHPGSKNVLNGIIVRENKVHNGIEMQFPSKPPAEIISRMKANGWRWSHTGGYWYNKMSPEAKVFAETLQMGVC